ncbi:MAG TPA: RNA 2',3'-cyclic phosphodiesterase [Gammaproteobacteria bacterium]|nr:RNA 2',3'-cyclic phosphodiesterase [Gammaproteobacteria bacterium]
MPRVEGQRLFFALWPDDELRLRLAELLESGEFRNAAGRAVAVENLHITLRYLGVISPAQQACAERVAAAIRAEGFSITLNRVGYWAGPRVAWLGAGEIPAPLQKLVAELESGLQGCGLPPETRPYRPHLTILRRARSDGLPRHIEPLPWQVEGFVLVRSVTVQGGVRYEVVRRWELGAAS